MAVDDGKFAAVFSGQFAEAGRRESDENAAVRIWSTLQLFVIDDESTQHQPIGYESLESPRR